MAVKIRLKRMGKKKQPTYRVVVADSRSPRDGRIIERLGRYDPRQEPSLVEIDNERAQYWLSTGAQPTDRVRKLLEISGAVARAKVSRSGVYRLDDDPPPAPPAAEKPVGQEAVESQEETKAESQETQAIREEPAAEQSETQPEAGGEVPAEPADSPEPLEPSEPSPVDEAKEAEETEETEVAEEAFDAGEPAPRPVGEDPPEASAESSEQTQDAQEVKDTQEKEEKAT